MKLTTEHKNAGILRLVSKEPNTDGSYVCYVDPKQVNHTGNRPRRKNHILKIANNFDPAYFTNPQLRYDKDKGLMGCNGSHRITSVLLNGKLEEVSANVFFDMNEKKSASVFYETQSVSLKMDPWDSFSAACHAGYGWARDIQNTLDKYKVTYPQDGLSKKCDINSFSVLKEAQEAKLLDEFIHAWSTLYKEQGGISKLNPFLRGFLTFLNGKDINKVITKLSKVTLGKISTKVKQYSPVSNRTDRKQYTKAFEFFYNK